MSVRPDLPQASSTIAPNGDVMLEVAHRGQTVGILNVTKMVSCWFERLGWFQDPTALKRLP